MKKYSYITLAVILLFLAVNKPLNGQEAGKSSYPRDWYNCSPEENGIYGAAVDEAYRFLEGKKIKSKPIVAIIAGGVDITHEALSGNIWQNPKEKPDKKDNDKNGYTDDCHGWNFLGGKNEEVVGWILSEGDREFHRLKDKYAGYMTDGKNWFKYVNGNKEFVSEPSDKAEYDYYTRQVSHESSIARARGGITLSYLLRDYAHIFDNELKVKYPERTDFGKNDFLSLFNSEAPRDSLREAAMMLIGLYFDYSQVKEWKNVYAHYTGDTQIQSAIKRYEEILKNRGNDGRKEIVGDDYLNIEDKTYGNAVLSKPAPTAGTMAAGIIAGKRGVANRNNPIAEQAQIMTLVVTGTTGEPYLKDMALAIRYAVNNGASVVMLPQQNTLYPPYGKQWMSEALKYAEDKGVLVVVPAWELSHDLSKVTFYPNRWMAGEKELSNLMVVSASDAYGNPVMESNYGARELDIYAPGENILSAVEGNRYQQAGGAVLAAATVSGVAALIKTYYPHLSGSRIRDILLESVTSRRGVEVEKGIKVGKQPGRDLFLFEQLTLSGGILNAFEAIKMADKL